jgi:hypothetical protein
MKTETLKLSKLKGNPSNPRVLRDEKFIKLKASIEAFPDMLQKRPIVAVTDKDGKYMVLGGNMRLKACADLGMKEVPVILADEWTEEQRREFIIKDNVGFGEWDWDQLANEWDAGQLSDWGLDVPFAGHEANSMTEDDLDMTEEFDPIGAASGLQKVTIVFDGPEEAESWLKSKSIPAPVKIGAAWTVNLSTQSIS